MSGEGDFLDRVEAIIRHVEAAPPELRHSLIQQQCGNDVELQREVEAMLQAKVEMHEGFLSRSAVAAVQGDDALHSQQLGPWRIEEQIGIGGMGAVYRGRRADGAFEQAVAIKVIRNTILDQRAHDRFLRERQILASLNHPNIASLLDGGVTEGGRPYLVMELVRGHSLLEYCDAQRATIQQRLALFEQVCDAVQHAHANLVVHRDLKPNNVLVDEEGRPRLVDFGIASIMDEAADAESVTVTGERQFTPQYAAPEQVRGEAVTVATDVYALGVILYELLTGVRPYEISGRNLSADTQAICDTDPPRPSRRLETTQHNDDDDGDDLSRVAALRQLEPAALCRALRSDIDHIVMMALRKEPHRRYATVEALREDLRRYRQGLPVAARPDSWSYRASRFVSRHRVAVVAGLMMFIVLTAAAIISTALALRLSDRSEELAAALTEREQALAEAEAERAEAERERRWAISSSATLIQMLESVADADATSRQAVYDDLRERVNRLDAMELPLGVNAEIASRLALANVARNIQAYDIALEQNRRVLELTKHMPQETTVRELAYGQIGWIHMTLGETEEAIEAFRAARKILAQSRDPQHLTVLDLQLIEALLIIGDEAAAQALATDNTLPPPPIDAHLRQELADLESRFGVPLTPGSAE